MSMPDNHFELASFSQWTRFETEMFKITKTFENSATEIFRIEGKISDENLSAWSHEISLIQSTNERHIILDLAQVWFINSKAVEMLMNVLSDRVFILNCGIAALSFALKPNLLPGPQNRCFRHDRCNPHILRIRNRFPPSPLSGTTDIPVATDQFVRSHARMLMVVRNPGGFAPKTGGRSGTDT